MPDRKLQRRNASQPQTRVGSAIHSAEAMALLASLDAEAVENAEARGEIELPADWSAAERAVLELIAGAVDRKVDLEARYDAAQDDIKLLLKLSGELRLIEANVARLLKNVNTDVPPEPTTVSRKASAAAKTRWRRGQGPA